MSISEVNTWRYISKRGKENSSLRIKPIATQQKMLSGFIALGAYTCGRGAVDEMVIITMCTKIAQSNAELGYATNTIFVVGIKIRFRQGANVFQECTLEPG